MKVISHNKILQSIYMIDCTLKPDLRCNFRQQYQSIINEIMTLIHYKFSQNFKLVNSFNILVRIWLSSGEDGGGVLFSIYDGYLDINQNFYLTGKVAFLLLLNQFLNTDSIIIKRDVHARFTSVQVFATYLLT